MELPKDILSGMYTKPNIFLCETNKDKICKLETTDTKATLKFNSYSELTFEVARVYNDTISGETKVNPFYDKIEALRLIEVEGIGYFELQGPELISDGIKESKSCKAYSLEYTLAQKYLDDFYINTGETDDRAYIYAYEKYGPNPENVNKNYKKITLYNTEIKELSLLHLVLEKIYGWRIGHIDPQLASLNRTFEIDRESVYDFLINELCDKFNCYVVFNTLDNTINIYAESPTDWLDGDGVTTMFQISNTVFSTVETVAIDGYKTTRWEYGIYEVNGEVTGVLAFNEPPAAGSRIEVIGTDSRWDTDVFITFENLSKEINVSYDADSIKTVLTVTYGEDENIREANLGLPYLTDISYYYNVDWMGQELYDAYSTYMDKTNASQADYTKNTKEITKWNDHITYEEHRLSLEYSVASVGPNTVGTYYILAKNADGSNYYAHVSLPDEYKVGTIYYSNASTNVQDGADGNVNLLYGAIESYFYNYFNYIRSESASEIKATYLKGMNDAIEEIKGLKDRFLFIESYPEEKRYTISQLAIDIQNGPNELVKAESIKKFLGFILEEVGRTPLNDLYLKRYEQRQEVNATYSNVNNENYGHYYPAVIFVESINAAIAVRDTKISEYKKQRKIPEDANAAISESLAMDKNFTENQLIRLSAFLREDELHIDDIIETSVADLEESFKLKQDAMESGRIELKKISQPRLQFSMDMANIYALPEFKPIVGQFQLGNIIRVGLRPDYIKQSRLLQVEMGLDDFSDFACEFGELTTPLSQSDIHADLLGQAISAGKSVATNSSYWTRGANQATSTDLKIQQGLLDATTQIKAMDGSQGVTIDKYGIRLQKLNNGVPDDRQAWLVNNMILFSDDGFKTSRTCLGEFKVDGEWKYGLLAEAVISGYVEGSKIVGGKLYSTNYKPDDPKTEIFDAKGTFMDLDNGAFELGNGKIKYDPDDDTLIMSGVTIMWDDNNIPPSDDRVADIIDGLNFTSTEISGEYVISPSIVGGYLSIEGNNSKVVIDPQNILGNDYIFQVNNGGSVTVGIKADGSASFTGEIIATSGQIGGCDIQDGKLQISSANISDTLTIGQLPDTVAQKSNIPTETEIVKISKGAIDANHISTLGLTVGDQITMGENATISWAQVTDQPTILTETRVTEITNDSISTASISADQISTGTLSAGNISLKGLFEVYDPTHGYRGGNIGYLEGDIGIGIPIPGVAMSSANNINYLIVTEAGVRMQSSDADIHVTDDKAEINGTIYINGVDIDTYIKNVIASS